MRHRIPQQLATCGVIGGSPLAILTRGAVAPRNRFRYVRTEKNGIAGALDYRITLEMTVDARSAEMVEGEHVDDAMILALTSVG